MKDEQYSYYKEKQSTVLCTWNPPTTFLRSIVCFNNGFFQHLQQNVLDQCPYLAYTEYFVKHIGGLLSKACWDIIRLVKSLSQITISVSPARHEKSLRLDSKYKPQSLTSSQILWQVQIWRNDSLRYLNSTVQIIAAKTFVFFITIHNVKVSFQVTVSFT